MVNAQPRLLLAVGTVLGTVAVGTIGYMVLADADPLDAVFMTVITLSTVGYREAVPLDGVERLWTIGLIAVGIAAVSFAISSMVSLFVGGELRAVLGRKRMQASIDRMENHIIICGCGRMGSLSAEALHERRLPVVVAESSNTVVQEMESLGIPFVHGDATHDETLLRAGVMRARAIVCALSSDADNVYVTVSARGLNSKLFIVARADQPATERKLMRAGADRVVCTQKIGATKVFNILTRPNVVDFLEDAAAGVELEVSEYVVAADSALQDRKLRDANLRNTAQAIVVAIKRADGSTQYNPEADEVIRAHDTLILIGRTGVATRLQEI